MSDVAVSVDVDVPVRTAYDQWARFESFPQFLDGVRSVRRIDARRTHWVVEVGGVRREFDAEIIRQRPDELIAWRSTHDADTSHFGAVAFQRLPGDRTRVTVRISWRPHGSARSADGASGVGGVVGGSGSGGRAKSDAERFKQFIERPASDA